MNQFCRHLVIKNSLNKSIFAVNKLNFSQTPKYISSSLLNSNNTIKYINFDYLPIKINTQVRLYVSSSKPYSGIRPQLKRNSFSEDRHSTIEADFKDAVPVESTGQSDYGSKTSDFSKFDLPAELLERLKELGYDKPFEIQEATLKHSLEGKDLVGKAFTGSGKTLGKINTINNYFIRRFNENLSKKKHFQSLSWQE